MNGAWNGKQQRLVRPASIDRWAVVVFDNGRDIERRVGDFVQVLTGNMRRLGMEIRTTPYIQRGGPDVAAVRCLLLFMHRKLIESICFV